MVPYGLKLASETKRGKGLPRVMLNKDITLADYSRLAQLRLADLVGPDQPPPPTQLRHAYVAIQSKQHVLRTVRLQRKTLSAFDDKRHVLPCGRHTLALGSAALLQGLDAITACPFCGPSMHL